jgi:peptidoglycan/LPS O-acetylase OafA/YrhL
LRAGEAVGAIMEAVGRIETVDVHRAEYSRPSTAVEKLGDLPALTGLRFFAAFFILVGHATPMMLKFTPSPQLVINVTNCIIEVGMELFFVLSGFVIHYNYADVGRRPHPQNLARFYIARFARIYPLYVLFLTLQHVLHGGDLRATAFFLGMTQSWVFIIFGGVPLIGHLSAFVTWSISTEWFFYCLYPVVGWLLAMTRHRLIASLVLVGLAWLGLALVVVLYLHDREINAFAQAVWGPPGIAFWGWLISLSPVGRLPPFLIGVATAHIFMTRYGRPVSESERRLGMILLTLALACLISMCGAQSVGSRYVNSIALFVYSLSIAVIIFCCARYRSPFSRFLSVPLLIACGDASYSIYLFHLSVLEVTKVSDILPWTWYNVFYVGFHFAAAVLITIAFSTVMYRVYEAPARVATRALLGRFIGPGASRADRYFPIALCVGIPVAFSIIGWTISFIRWYIGLR